MTRRDAATERQVQAAAPDMSTWLSANAGSGKTRVLTDRVARLLLSGVQPQHILCMTYTKAAASEMQNKLFGRLGAWAMLETDELRKALNQLGVETGTDTATLNHARTLFARAIETPGGLRIQTIHSFCAALLRRFPLEAGVSPQFTEMDDRSATLLREEIVDLLASGDEAERLDALTRHYTGENFNRLTAEICKHRDAFGPDIGHDDIWRRLELDPADDEASVLSLAFRGDEAEIISRLIPHLQQGTANDQKAAVKLSELGQFQSDISALVRLESVFLTKSGESPYTAKIESFPTKGTQAALGSLLDDLHALMLRVEKARDKRTRLATAQKTYALHRFAQSFLPAYDRQKQEKGWLDFDDLIDKARALLKDPQVAEWVLFKLDGGIDHILVDEAQDTSPTQWDVIELLAREFTVGEGARAGLERTIFVVGDKKQSIYSFQGADPEGFDRMRHLFEARLGGVGAPFQNLQLEYSFRSASPILDLVDQTARHSGSDGLGAEVLHKAHKKNMPGRVDLWPEIPKSEEPEKREWEDPTDMTAPNHHSVRLAKTVADTVNELLESGSIPAETGNTGDFKMRPVRAGDVLILVQQRSGPLFSEIIRACKAAGLPIAGADRLKIGAELAVKDLTALLSFLSIQEDDLSLASILRSPLFGWDEQALFDLAHRRAEGSFLWQALRSRREEFPETLKILDALRQDADFLRPYELLERCLTRWEGRQKLLARLGSEAEEGIDALLSQALVYERAEVPSLTGFLVWLSADEVEIKRQMDSAGDRIRVMTVHGAKGLEAPIVILPDTDRRNVQIRDDLISLPGDGLVWKMTADQRSAPEREALSHLKALQVEERMRLLYVAMTRAEKWLIICGAGDLGKDDNSWHALIAKGMKSAGAIPCAQPTGPGLRLQTGAWADAPRDTGSGGGGKTITLPDWAKSPADIPERSSKPVAPSDLGGAKALPGATATMDNEAAKRRGRILHLLLEHLPGYPGAQWPDIAPEILASGSDVVRPDEIGEVLAEATRVLSAPELKFLFAPDAMAEVEVTANLPELGARRIRGTIDRLLVEPERILVVDFKTNATVPADHADVPEGILRQMGAYASAVAQIYPDRRVETAILWTRTAKLMPLQHEVVTAALRAATIS